MISIGYNNYVNKDKIIVILSKDSSPIKKFLDYARSIFKVVDATQGRPAKTIILCNDDMVYISALPPTSIARKSGIFKLIGYECYVNIEKVSSVVNVTSSPVKKFIAHYESTDMILNATFGRPRRSAIVTSDGYVILTAKATRTLVENLDDGIRSSVEVDAETEKEESEE